jgi:hypothetical protein
MNDKLTQLKESFAELKALEDERSRLMAVLQMWGEVVAQGINSDDIKSFGFCLAFVKKERFDKEPWYGKWVGNTRSCPEWYNYVTLKDGTKVPLEVYVKAPPTKGTDVSTCLPCN